MAPMSLVAPRSWPKKSRRTPGTETPPPMAYEPVVSRKSEGVEGEELMKGLGPVFTCASVELLEAT